MKVTEGAPKHLDQNVIIHAISSKQAFRFPNANNDFYLHLLVKDTNLKPDILEPIKDTLEVELGKVAGLSPLVDTASGSGSKGDIRKRAPVKSELGGNLDSATDWNGVTLHSQLF